ncbi:hypothetical protein L6164_003985 [Bauhinia variegata]|uniref:Uncharacterized protein n=1 Tax=Bauhinia variegata TaxID=167791 RepID=A0ACB9Q330_BAUVA|nr:hypothetical protein L6164_003985 [Bauhinia variegata]
MVGSKPSLPSWMSAAASRVDFEGNVSSMKHNSFISDSGGSSEIPQRRSDLQLSFPERALSAAGAAFLSAIIVNPLDVAKTRLQAQAAGVPYQGICQMTSFETNTVLPDIRCPGMPKITSSDPACPLGCNRYKGTLDVFYKVMRQEGFTRLWRGTSASLALAVPTVGIYMPCYDVIRNLIEGFTTQNAPILTPYVPLVAGSVARSLACVSCYPIELARTRMQAFRETQSSKPPGVRKTLLGVINPVKSTSLLQNLHRYRYWWTGLGAQLARDVPFSAICWSTLEPIRKRILGLAGDEAGAATVVGANFSAGYVAGTLAAAATCPLDVAKTRRQIEKDPERALNMTTRKTLLEIWRDGGLRGLFTGVGPRVGRAGPSVGIVVSFYEVVNWRGVLFHFKVSLIKVYIGNTSLSRATEINNVPDIARNQEQEVTTYNNPFSCLNSLAHQ